MWNSHLCQFCRSAYRKRIYQIAGIIEILTISLNYTLYSGVSMASPEGSQQSIMVLDIEFFTDIRVTTHVAVYILTSVTRQMPKNRCE